MRNLKNKKRRKRRRRKRPPNKQGSKSNQVKMS